MYRIYLHILYFKKTFIIIIYFCFVFHYYFTRVYWNFKINVQKKILDHNKFLKRLLFYFLLICFIFNFFYLFFQLFIIFCFVFVLILILILFSLGRLEIWTLFYLWKSTCPGPKVVRRCRRRWRRWWRRRRWWSWYRSLPNPSLSKDDWGFAAKDF